MPKPEGVANLVKEHQAPQFRARIRARSIAADEHGTPVDHPARVAPGRAAHAKLFSLEAEVAETGASGRVPDGDLAASEGQARWGGVRG